MTTLTKNNLTNNNKNNNMNKYEQEAQDFCDKTNTKVSWKYKGWEKHFADDKEPRNTWFFKIERGGRKYEGVFGDSVKRTMDFWKKNLHTKDEYSVKETLEADKWTSIKPWHKKTLDKIGEWQETNENTPTKYDILACLTKYYVGTIDDFVADFGYDFKKPSEVIKIYEAVKKEYEGIAMLYNEAELELLRDIS